MAAMQLEVEYDDGEKVVVKVRPLAIVQFEAAGNRMSTEPADGMSWIYKLAFFALGKPTGNFDKWLETVEECSTVGEDGDDEEVGEDAAPFTDG